MAVRIHGPSLSANELAANSVDTAELVNGAVTNGKLGADAVTGAKLADDAVDSEHLVDGSIDPAHLAADSVETAKLAASAVTGTKIASGALKAISFDGRSGAGACTLAGAAAGDRVLVVFGITGGALGDAAASFESAITVNDQVQQSAGGDLSTNDYVAILVAASA